MTVILRPRPVTRVANSGIGLVLLALAVGLWNDREVGTPVWLAGLTGAVGLVLAMRGYRMSISLGQDELRVRGQLLSRRIPRDSIDSIERVTSFTAVRWRSVGGRRRWSPILSLRSTGRSLDSSTRHNEEGNRQLRRWMDRRSAQ